jgi:8-oxoguanine deaminase
MTTLLLKNAHLLTMDDHHTELADGGLFIENGFISKVGATRDLPSIADEVLDLTGHVVLPQAQPA